MTNEKKAIKRICKNCKLFNPVQSQCAVVILHNGQRHHLPVEARDKCFFEREFVALDGEGGVEYFTPEIQEVQFWTEDPITGEKTSKDGVVKIKYPEGFFGDEEKNESQET
jgi:hypothetical protein